MSLPAGAVAAIRWSPALAADLAALADCGGRFSGTESEARARRWLGERLGRIPGVTVAEHVFTYAGWRRRSARLRLLGAGARDLACHSLVWCPDTPPGGLEADVIDVGRGTPADFDRVRADLKGRIALVRHEYPFVPDTIHRRVKYQRSRDQGAVGFVIANNLPDAGLVTGSSGQGRPDDIPAVGVSHETGTLLAARRGEPVRIRLDVQSERSDTTAANLVVDVGPSPAPAERRGSAEVVVVCAHYDGHDLAESALDNGTGVVGVIQVVEALAPFAARWRRALRAMLFTTEEWRLHGSAVYVDALGQGELDRIGLVVNLDTLAGSARLSALTSGFPGVADLVTRIGADLGEDIGVIPRLLPNSDHFNFARRGVPALRLVAGFGEPGSRVRYLLTEGDTRNKVEPAELERAVRIAAEIVWTALTQESPLPPHTTAAEMERLL